VTFESFLAVKPKKAQTDGKDHPPKHTANTFNIWCLILITAFFITMITSRYIIKPAAKAYEIGPIVKGEASYTEVSSLWDKRKREIEFIISADGNYIEYEKTDPSLRVTTATGLKRLRGTTVLLTPDTIVVRFQSVPNDTFVTELNVTLYSQGNSTGLTFFENRNTITQGEITEKTENEYRIASHEGQVNRYQEVIEAAKNKIQDNAQAVSDLDAQIERIREQEQYMTAKQITDAEKTISQINSDKKAYISDSETQDQNIAEYKNRIELLTEQIEDLKGGTK